MIVRFVPLGGAAGYDNSYWWDNSWEYRLPVIISGTHPENYHLQLVVPYNARMQADYRDLRFIENETAGELNYWIENFTENEAIVWVLRKSFDSDVYVYYGNTSAGSNSNWSNTILPYVDSQATASASWAGRLGHTALSYDGKMWVLGGYNGIANDDDVWYSTDGENWTQATSDANWSPRRDHTSVEFDNKMWVIGGSDSSVWYSTDGENWTQATASPGWTSRWGHTSVVFDNKIWVIGGFDGAYKSDVWYTSDGENWTQATTAANWSARHGQTSIAFGDNMWVLGGYSNGVYKNDVWYSSDGENWTQATTAAAWAPKRYHSSVGFDNLMWVMAGNGELWDEYGENIWYSSDGQNWTQVMITPGWTPRYDQATIVHDNKVWLLGGYDGGFNNGVWRLLRIFTSPEPTATVGSEEPGWKHSETWESAVSANASWSGVDGWTASINTSSAWSGVENWNGTIGMTEPAWGAVDGFGETVVTSTGWSLAEGWSGTITTPSAPSSPPPGGGSTTSTSLSISPSSFSLESRGTVTLTATLRDNSSNAISSKTISWSATSGNLSAASGTTDNSGQISVTFTAPSVTATENVTITASFSGDSSYGSSQATSSGTVSFSMAWRAVDRFTGAVGSPSTSLTISQSSSVIGSENTLELTATLITGSTTLSGKTITWSVASGSFSQASSTTDNSGQATVIFTAPAVAGTTQLTITAAFAGDNLYSPSTATAGVTVVVQEVAETLENLRENFVNSNLELDISLDNEQMQDFENAFAVGNLGAVIEIRTGLAENFQTAFQHGDVSISVRVDSSAKVDVTVSSDVENGKTIVLNVDNATIPVLNLGEVMVLYDNQEIGQADDYEDILDPTNENVPEYLLVSGNRGIQVLVSIPTFSPHTITITTLPTQPFGATLPINVIIIAAIGMAIVLLVFLWRQISIGSKKLKSKK